MSAQVIEVSLLGRRNGAPFRTGCVWSMVKMTKASNK